MCNQHQDKACRSPQKGLSCHHLVSDPLRKNRSLTSLATDQSSGISDFVTGLFCSTLSLWDSFLFLWHFVLFSLRCHVPLCKYTILLMVYPSCWWLTFGLFPIFNSCAYFILFYKFIYLFLAALGLRCCAWAFSSCSEQGPLFIAVRGLLTAAASLVAEHGL